MTAKSSDSDKNTLKESSTETKSVRTGTSTFSNGKPVKAATERTGGDLDLNNKYGLFRKIQIFYENNIYRRVNHLRGTTRLNSLLYEVARLAGDRPETISGNGTGISELEWDNLIILDACRQDLYEEVTGISDSRISLGSHSADFVKNNFSEGDYSDTVVVTANPHYHPELFKQETGRDIEDVFHTVFHSYMDNWDEEEGTVLPESVLKQINTAANLFPKKRLLIHFMQPHNPFIQSDLDISGFKHLWTDEQTTSYWDFARERKLDKDDIWPDYKDNLELVLETVDDLEKILTGKTVITSDHGNLVGEHGLYSHPRGRDYKVLRKVPLEVREL